MSADKVAATFHGADIDPCPYDHALGTCALCGAPPVQPDLTPEQDLRAAVADMLASATHFNVCPGGTDTCRCLIGRLNWAINAEQVDEATDPTKDAIEVVAREVTEQMLDPMDLGDLWSDYAEIGEDDWRDVVNRVLDRAQAAKPDDATYKAAYAHLQGRAEAWAAANDPA